MCCIQRWVFRFSERSSEIITMSTRGIPTSPLDALAATYVCMQIIFRLPRTCRFFFFITPAPFAVHPPRMIPVVLPIFKKTQQKQLKVTLFTTEYILRFYSIVEATDASSGERVYADSLAGRLRWAVTDFYSWVDLASIVPFYLDILVAQDLPATQFIR